MTRTVSPRTAGNVVGIFGVPALLFMLLDCGPTVSAQGVVVDRQIEVNNNCSKDGCYTSRDFVLIVNVPTKDDFIDVQVARKDYYKAQMNQPVTVKYQKGRLTKMWWFPRLDKEQGTW